MVVPSPINMQVREATQKRLSALRFCPSWFTVPGTASQRVPSRIQVESVLSCRSHHVWLPWRLASLCAPFDGFPWMVIHLLPLGLGLGGLASYVPRPASSIIDGVQWYGAGGSAFSRPRLARARRGLGASTCTPRMLTHTILAPAGVGFSAC